MFKKLVIVFAFAIGFVASAFGQTEDFKGDFKVDQKQLSGTKKIALVDISGQTKLDSRQVAAWTDTAAQALAEQARKAGFDVVVGPEVKAAYADIAPFPTLDDLKSAFKKKNKMNDADAERTAKGFSENWAKHDAGDSAKFGFTLYRPEESVNLSRPVFSQDDPGNPKVADKKEVQRRIAALREKLGVDAVVLAEFGFGSGMYDNQAKGAGKGLFGAIDAVKGVKKGTQAETFINLEFYDRDGKNNILTVKGSCMSKEGTGISLKVNSKVEEMIPDTSRGCIEKVFEKLGKH